MSGAEPPARPLGRHRRLLLVGGGALLLASIARALSDTLSAPAAWPGPVSSTVASDFRDAAYLPVREFLSGGDPYRPSNMFQHWGASQEFDLYLPHHLLLHLPVGWMPFREGWILYLLLSVTAVVGGGLLAARAVRLPGGWASAMAVAAVALASQPGNLMTYVGNVNSFVWLGAVAALGCTTERRGTWWAALGLAVAWIKPQYGIPLTIIMFALGRRAAARRGTAMAALLSIPVALILVAREGGLSPMLDVLRENIEYARSTPYGSIAAVEAARVDLSTTLHQLGIVFPSAEIIISLVVLTAVGAVLHLSARTSSQPTWALLLATTTVMLVFVHSRGELLLPLSGAAAAAHCHPSTRQDRAVRRLELTAAAVTVIPLLLTPSVIAPLTRSIGRSAALAIEPWALVLAFALAAMAALRRLARQSREDHAPAQRQPAP